MSTNQLVKMIGYRFRRLSLPAEEECPSRGRVKRRIATGALNYIGIGVHNAARGVSPEWVIAKIRLHKFVAYGNMDVEEHIEWAMWGMQRYHQIRFEREGREWPPPDRLR